MNGRELILSSPDPYKLFFFQKEKQGLIFFDIDSKSLRKCCEVLSVAFITFLRAWQRYPRKVFRIM